MENCLVTKLKAKVSGNDFATLNTIYLDLLEASRRGANTTNAATFFVITGEESVDIEFAKGVSQSGQSVVFSTIPPNTKRSFVIDSTAIGESAIEGFVKISGHGIYTLRGLSCNYKRLFDFNNSTKKNLNTLSYANAMEAYGGYFNLNAADNMLPASIRYITLDIGSNMSVEDVNNFFNKIPKVEYIKSTPYGSNNVPINISFSPNIVNSSTIVALDCSMRGTTAQVPINLKLFGISQYYMTGTIEELVERMRNAGRTVGVITFNGLTSTWFITYKGIALTNNPDIPKQSGTSYLQWTEDSISWTATAPAGAMRTMSPFDYI